MKSERIKNSLLFGLTVLLSLFLFNCETDLSNADDQQTLATSVNNRGSGPAAAPSIVDICQCLETNYPKEELSEAEKEALLFMREEEKLARDVYLELGKKWNYRIFSNIAESEQRHMDAVACLLSKYGLDDPAEGKAAGAFTNQALQQLYTQLLESGLVNLNAALSTGARIEDLDLYDLERQTAMVDNKDIVAVFGELAKGSRNHLRAFTTNLTASGGSYQPEYLGADRYAAILSGAHETGGAICGMCPGGGNGAGRGQGTCMNKGQGNTPNTPGGGKGRNGGRRGRS